MTATTALDDLRLKLQRLAELIRAVEQGDVEGVRSLLEVDRDGTVPVIRWPAPSGVTDLLNSAAHHGHVEVVRLLLESGADVNASDSNGGAAICHAVYGNAATVRLLLESGARVDQPGTLRATALTLAVAQGGNDVTDRSDLIAVLLAAGANPNARNEKALVPLHMAISHSMRPGGVEVVRLLAAAGADLGSRDELGSSPLHIAVREASDEVVGILLDAGADVNLRDKHGMTPAAEAEFQARRFPESSEYRQRLTALAATLKAREKHGRFGFGRR
jgi:ankyrin repeat protein